jgi:hypothetical protein
MEKKKDLQERRSSGSMGPSLIMASLPRVAGGTEVREHGDEPHHGLPAQGSW